MDRKLAVRLYQFGERAKSELIIVSQLLMFLEGLQEDERAGGKKVVLQVMDLVRSENLMAVRDTENRDFKTVGDKISEAIGLAESDRFGEAAVCVGGAISAATTAAMAGWEKLEKDELL